MYLRKSGTARDNWDASLMWLVFIVQVNGILKHGFIKAIINLERNLPATPAHFKRPLKYINDLRGASTSIGGDSVSVKRMQTMYLMHLCPAWCTRLPDCPQRHSVALVFSE
jgi:hypothetical protein